MTPNEYLTYGLCILVHPRQDAGAPVLALSGRVMQYSIAPDRVAVAERAIVLLRQGHCRGAAARDKNGEFIDPCGHTAISWCPHGAVWRAAQDVVPDRSMAHLVHTCVLLGMWHDLQGLYPYTPNMKPSTVAGMIHLNDIRRLPTAAFVAALEKYIAEQRRLFAADFKEGETDE